MFSKHSSLQQENPKEMGRESVQRMKKWGIFEAPPSNSSSVTTTVAGWLFTSEETIIISCED